MLLVCVFSGLTIYVDVGKTTQPQPCIKNKGKWEVLKSQRRGHLNFNHFHLVLIVYACGTQNLGN